MITKDTKIMEVVQNHPESIAVFQNHGLGCVGCMLANFETLGEGAMAHGIDIDTLLEDLNNLPDETEEVVVED